MRFVVVVSPQMPAADSPANHNDKHTMSALPYSLRLLCIRYTIGAYGLHSTRSRQRTDNQEGPPVPLKRYRFCPQCALPLSEGMVEGRVRLHCASCGFIRYENPLPVVVAVAVQDGRFLLIKRGIPPKKGYWGCPSGFVESGESPEEACLRELREEAGVTGQVSRLLRVARLEDEELYGDMLVVSYLVKIIGGTPAAGDEVDEVRYHTPDQLPGYLAISLRDVIREMSRGS